MEELTYEERLKKFLTTLSDICLEYDLGIAVDSEYPLLLVDERMTHPDVELFNESGTWKVCEKQ